MELDEAKQIIRDLRLKRAEGATVAEITAEGKLAASILNARAQEIAKRQGRRVRRFTVMEYVDQAMF